MQVLVQYRCYATGYTVPEIRVLLCAILPPSVSLIQIGYLSCVGSKEAKMGLRWHQSKAPTPE